MGWAEFGIGATTLVVLGLLVAAFRGVGRAGRKAEKDSSDRWLHADMTRNRTGPDGPVTEQRDTGESDAGGDGD